MAIKLTLKIGLFITNFQINRRYVLTAAHCNSEKNPITAVRLGEYDFARDPDCEEDGCKSSKNLIYQLIFEKTQLLV